MAVPVGVEIVVAAVILAVVNHRVLALGGTVPARAAGAPGERLAREAARPVVADGGVGLITGHTLQPELARIGTGFYANTGACGEVVEERRARLGLPPVYVHLLQVSWVEIEAGAEVHARLLLLSRRYPRPTTLLERFAAGRMPRARPRSPTSWRPTPVALVWPRSTTRSRRFAGSAASLPPASPCSACSTSSLP